MRPIERALPPAWGRRLPTARTRHEAARAAGVSQGSRGSRGSRGWLGGLEALRGHTWGSNEGLWAYRTGALTIKPSEREWCSGQRFLYWGVRENVGHKPMGER